MNQTDFLIEFEASDNPTLFAIKLGNTHTWLGMELHMDAHIGTAMTLEKVSKQCEEARDIVDNARIMTRQEYKQFIRKTKGKEDFRRRFYQQRRHNVESVRIHVTKNRRFREDS